MIAVIVPITFLLVIVLVKKLPVIGGNVHVALLVAGASALLMSGIYNPMDWFRAWIDGLDRLSWVILIAIVGMIYAETQITMGTMDTVLDTCRSAFGRSPKGLYISAMLAMIIFGALLGEGLSVATVVGVLCVGPLYDLGLEPEDISATLVLGALLGSLCPPMSNGTVLAASLCNADYETVLKWSFITMPLCIAVITVIYAFRMVKIKALPAHLIPEKKAGQILREGWKLLIPMGLLLLIMILRFGPWSSSVNLDFVSILWSPVTRAVAGIPFLSGISNLIVLSLVTVTIVSFCFKKVRQRGVGDIVRVGWKKFLPCGSVQACCALMLGGFYAGGLIQKIEAWASTLHVGLLKIGGSAAMGLMGMVTGSQSTVQNTILSFFGPALTATGMTPERAALAGSHIAMASQAFPPSDLCTIVVVGLVAGVIGKKCDYVKSMMKSLPGFLILYFFGVGLLFI